MVKFLITPEPNQTPKPTSSILTALSMEFQKEIKILYYNISNQTIGEDHEVDIILFELFIGLKHQLFEFLDKFMFWFYISN